MRALRMFALLVLLLVTVAGAWLWYALYVPYGNYPQEGVFVEVRHGMPRRAIARLLEEKGVIRNRWAFEAFARWVSGHTLQAGEYFFNRPMTAPEVFQVIADGRVYTVGVTVPEGYSMFDIAELMERQKFTTREEFLKAAYDPAPIRDLAPGARSLEGFLFPAKYEFPRHVTAQRIAETMVKRFRQVWSAFQEPPGNVQGVSTLEAVTMASLVEKETGVADERPIIAGVFYNRLRRGVALQCDPTVVYAMQLAGRNDGVINRSDLRLDSPYNTYRHRGLPPGPIANPGAASLRAALHPPYVEYLYFVANMEGGHFFSKSLAEHSANVARYRRLQNGSAPASQNKRPR